MGYILNCTQGSVLIHTCRPFILAGPPREMFLDVGRNLENPEGTRGLQVLQTSIQSLWQLRMKAGNLELRDSNASMLLEITLEVQHCSLLTCLMFCTKYWHPSVIWMHFLDTLMDLLTFLVLHFVSARSILQMQRSTKWKMFCKTAYIYLSVITIKAQSYRSYVSDSHDPFFSPSLFKYIMPMLIFRAADVKMGR